MIDFFIPAAFAQEGAAAGGGGLTFFEPLLLVGVLAIFYLLIWRPQSKRAKEHRELVAGLGEGDEIITNAGMLGLIKEVREDFILVEIAEGVCIRMQRSAVTTTLPKGTRKGLEGGAKEGRAKRKKAGKAKVAGKALGAKASGKAESAGKSESVGKLEAPGKVESKAKEEGGEQPG